MQLLLRKSAVNELGNVEFSDIELSGDEIAIGSAPDCPLQLLGEAIGARHAVLRMQGGRARAIAGRSVRFLHNGDSVAQAELKVGDTLAFGAHELAVVAPPGGFELALEWRPAQVEGRYLARAYRTSLRETALRPRVAAWAIALLVLIGGGLFPLADYFYRLQQAPSAQAAAHAPPAQRITADKFWSSGPLHAAHQVAIGDRCEACHSAPFAPVQDTACAACHKDMPDHVARDNPAHAQLAAFQCQSCHKEHNRPSSLVVRESSLCVNCHSGLKTPVTAFAPGQHPEFRVSLLRSTVTRESGGFSIAWSQQRLPIAAAVDAAAPAVRENSHLKFSHAQHLDGGRVQNRATGAALNCASCHTLGSDRQHFEPITMERSCSGCHELGFDAQQPQRQLPHADVTALFETLDAHFIAKAYGREPEPSAPPRRIPGHYATFESCRGDLNCARAQALREAERQFTQSGCVSCHDIETFPQAAIRERWQVVPVRLARDWYPAARFDHALHMTRIDANGQRAQGDAVCAGCHAAQQSKDSADVLMPASGNCLQCHSSGPAAGVRQAPLQCVSCHAFHQLSAGHPLAAGHSLAAESAAGSAVKGLPHAP